MRHLWEPEHPYYCSENDTARHDSWSDYEAKMGNADVDLNLVFRWDIHIDGDEDGKPPADWTRATLTIHIVQQRKGRHRTHEIRMTRDDEPAIFVYLTKHWETMQAVWAPFAADSGPGADEMRAQLRARRIAALRAELAELEQG